MIYKNSLKIMMVNFWLVSRILAFFVVQFLLLFGVSFMFCLPIVRLLSQNSFFQTAQTYYNQYISTWNMSQAVEHLKALLNNFFNIISQNMAQIGWAVLGLVVTLLLLGAFLSNFYSLIVSNVLYQSMSNKVKYKFMPSLVSTLPANLKYSFLSLFIKLPVDVLIFAMMLGLLQQITFSGGWVVLEPFILILVLLLLLTVRVSLFYGWSPAIVTFGRGLFYGLDRSFKLSFRNAKKVFANSFYMVLTLFVINLFAAQVTFGVSLILTIPMSILLYHTFSMVLFYSNYGMRYYLDEYNVIVPSKLENNEPIGNLKYII